MDNLKIEYIDPKLLVPDPENAKEHTDEQVDQIVRSMESFGMNDPIGVWKDNLIVEGHGRLMAALQIGMETVPIIRLDHLTDQERRAYMLAHNKLTMNTGFELPKLEAALELIEEFRMEDFGFLSIDEEKEKKEGEEWFDNRERWEGAKEDDEEEYKEFLEKFENKKTTDDCYTPDNIYKVIENYVEEEYGAKKENFVRPFYPGGDYKNRGYKTEEIVVDNPPFSILAEIVKTYKEMGVRFFLFAPGLMFGGKETSEYTTMIIANADITYENGATVRTNFVTNLGDSGIRAKSDPELNKRIREENKKNLRKMKRQLPKYKYPAEVITAAAMGYLAEHGEAFEFRKDESERISAMDEQKEAGKSIFGGGFLLSKQKAAERAAAERAAAKTWELSEREKEIIRALGEKECLKK